MLRKNVFQRHKTHRTLELGLPSPHRPFKTTSKALETRKFASRRIDLHDDSTLIKKSIYAFSKSTYALSNAINNPSEKNEISLCSCTASNVFPHAFVRVAAVNLCYPTLAQSLFEDAPIEHFSASVQTCDNHILVVGLLCLQN